MTRSDYQLVMVVAVAVLVAFVVNACFAISVTPRAMGAGPAPSAGGTGEETEAAINAYRASLGKPALRHDGRLAGAASFHNQSMRDGNCFSHVCPNEPDPSQRALAAGYPSGAVAEVIGRGYLDVSSVVNGWRNSAGHDAILRGSYLDVGCDMLAGQAGPWWTCVFGSAGTGASPAPTAGRATPTPAPRPLPTPTAGPRPALPGGWVMEVTGRFGVFGLPRPTTCPQLAGLDCLLTLRVEYDRSDWSVTDYLYSAYCRRADVVCRWTRER